jgi:hypothetical protein
VVVCAPQPRLVSNTSSALELSGVRSVLFLGSVPSLLVNPHTFHFFSFLDFPHLSYQCPCDAARDPAVPPAPSLIVAEGLTDLSCIHSCDLSRHLMHGFSLGKIKLRLMILTQRLSHSLIFSLVTLSPGGQRTLDASSTNSRILQKELQGIGH